MDTESTIRLISSVVFVIGLVFASKIFLKIRKEDKAKDRQAEKCSVCNDNGTANCRDCTPDFE